jgi:lipopolysaccharide transport system ATP-binding protein
MNAAVLGLSRDEIDDRYESIISFADIGDFIEQPVKTYSSGMVVRLAFAVIAHVDASVLVIDEALAVGDTFFNQKCMRFLREFMKSGTVLFVTHDTAAVTSLCTRGILLSGGYITKMGYPKEVCESYLSAVFDLEGGLKYELGEDADRYKDRSQVYEKYRDMRESLINSSNLRNDIEVLIIGPDERGSGTGHVNIKSVKLLDMDGELLSWIVGGEDVVLEIQCLAYIDVVKPIVGFQIKDRHGQIIFADNSYLIYRSSPIFLPSGKTIVSKFWFRLPVLPAGDYCIAAGLAEGTQESHIMHCWIHEGMFFRVHSSSVLLGLVGLPIQDMEMKIVDP